LRIPSAIAVKKAWNPKKSLRDDEDSFYQHFKLNTLAKINRSKIRSRQHQNHHIPATAAAADPHILKVTTLLDSSHFQRAR
jgi:hypothetical protein